MSLALRNAILDAWVRSTNGAERGAVLDAVGSALFEIMVERLGGERVLRSALRDAFTHTTSIILDRYHLPFGPPDGREGNARMAAIGGIVDAEMARRAERMGLGYAELRGVHAQRWFDAIAAQGPAAAPHGGYTCGVREADPMRVKCLICEAAAGAACSGLPTRRDGAP